MNDFIGKNYTVPQLDLSVKPEDTAENTLISMNRPWSTTAKVILATPTPSCSKTAIFLLYIPTATARVPFSIK